MVQTRPPRGRKTTLEEAPRIATIHEYLDWTVTAEDALGEHDLVLFRPTPIGSNTQPHLVTATRTLPRGALARRLVVPELHIPLSSISVCHYRVLTML